MYIQHANTYDKQFDELFSIICELTKFVQDNIDDLTNYFQIQ